MSPSASGSVSTGLLVPASAAVVALALAAGLRPDAGWLVWLLILAAMVQGALAGAAFRRFWRGPARDEIFGAGGRYAGFLATVLFSAVEAHAVGFAVAEKGAPQASVALLLPPVVLAAAALRSAVKVRREEATGGEPADVPAPDPDGDDEPSKSEERGRRDR